MAKKKRVLSGREQRNMRVQQIVFALIALMIIFVMILSLVAK